MKAETSHSGKLNVVLSLSPPQRKFIGFTAITCATAKTTVLNSVLTSVVCG